MTPFQRAQLPPEAYDVREMQRKFGCTLARAQHLVAEMKRATVWLNDEYQVSITPLTPAEDALDAPPMVHLSIKRRDKEPIHDWRALQQIKNELVGPECEGLELYPAESRKVDSANQYHLYVFADAGTRVGFGFEERFVDGEEGAAAVGAKQRPFK
jgi:hypothetical protein